MTKRAEQESAGKILHITALRLAHG